MARSLRDRLKDNPVQVPEQKPSRSERIKRRNDYVRENMPDDDNGNLDFDVDGDLFEASIEEEQKEKKAAKQRKILFILIAVASMYIVVLIYGAVITEFAYGQSGQVEPVVMNVEEIARKQDFNTILTLYTQTQGIYEEILTLDYRVALGQEALEAIAPDYQCVLESVLTLATNIDGTTCSTENQQIKNLMYTWTATYLSDYCKYMITALSQNGTADGELAGENAIACRSNYLEPNFQMIIQNLVTIGSGIKGVDLSDVMDWNPHNVAKKIQGLSE